MEGHSYLREREREREGGGGAGRDRDLCRLWKYDNTHCAGVNTSTGLSLWNSLHSVHTTLVLQVAKHTSSTDAGTGILITRHGLSNIKLILTGMYKHTCTLTPPLSVTSSLNNSKAHPLKVAYLTKEEH